jgi:hypothetical protein
MTQPAVNLTEQDGQLGVLPPSSGRLLALVGAAPSATLAINTPASYGRVKDLKTALVRGPLLEAAAHHIERYGKPVVIVRTADTTAGAGGSVTFTGTGTSVITISGADEPEDDYEVYLKVILGGTIGTGPITIRVSLDGGRTLSGDISLGTANSYDIPDPTGGLSGVRLAFAAGTLVTGDIAVGRTTAPQWNSSEVGAALDALGLATHNWEGVEIVGAVDATTFDTINGKIEGMATAGKNHWWIGNCRVPNVGESEATYLSAMNTIFSSKTTKHGVLCFGAVKMVSSISGRNYKRPVSHIAGAWEASKSEEVDGADINLGALPCSIRDSNGNPDEHDETANPGADDGRFYTLRTWEGYPGVYVNRPRLFSVTGSDFQLLPHRRVMNIARDVLRNYFTRRLNKPIRVDKSTGFILEAEALEIEKGATAALRSALTQKPKASDATFVLSRTDNILSTSTLTGDARIVPLAYPEIADLSLSYFNPALQLLAA